MPSGEISSRTAEISRPNSLTCATSRSFQMEVILLWQGMMLPWSRLVSRLSRSMKDWQGLRVNCQLALGMHPSRNCQDWAHVADFYRNNVEMKYISSVFACFQFEPSMLLLPIQAICSYFLCSHCFWCHNHSAGFGCQFLSVYFYTCLALGWDLLRTSLLCKANHGQQGKWFHRDFWEVIYKQHAKRISYSTSFFSLLCTMWHSSCKASDYLWVCGGCHTWDYLWAVSNMGFVAFWLPFCLCELQHYRDYLRIAFYSIRYFFALSMHFVCILNGFGKCMHYSFCTSFVWFTTVILLFLHELWLPRGLTLTNSIVACGSQSGNHAEFFL